MGGGWVFFNIINVEHMSYMRRLCSILKSCSRSKIIRVSLRCDWHSTWKPRNGGSGHSQLTTRRSMWSE